MLSKSVLVKGVNNLSDARYCAGMGVDFIAFELNTESDNYVDPIKILEIKNWLVGIKVGLRVAECNDLPVEIINEIKPDFLILSNDQYKEAPLDNHVFVEVGGSVQDRNKVFSLLTTSESLEQVKPELTANTYVEFTNDLETIKKFIKEDLPAGLVLNGGKETRPGFSDYGNLMDILELLDE